mmetsp:Transcript_641/g.1481  ORF Transcript_641/g.1481 Transcript_641/m.1481 type:complete len:256 (+) Transcript_641:644-1411(+)
MIPKQFNTVWHSPYLPSVSFRSGPSPRDLTVEESLTANPINRFLRRIPCHLLQQSYCQGLYFDHGCRRHRHCSHFQHCRPFQYHSRYQENLFLEKASAHGHLQQTMDCCHHRTERSVVTIRRHHHFCKEVAVRRRNYHHFDIDLQQWKEVEVDWTQQPSCPGTQSHSHRNSHDRQRCPCLFRSHFSWLSRSSLDSCPRKTCLPPFPYPSHHRLHRTTSSHDSYPPDHHLRHIPTPFRTWHPRHRCYPKSPIRRQI